MDLNDALYVKRNYFKINDETVLIKNVLFEDGKVLIEICTKEEVPITLIMDSNDNTKVFNINEEGYGLKLKK